MAVKSEISSEVKAAAITLMSKEMIKRGQDTIRTSLTKLDSMIHQNAVQCLLHAETHGDTSLMRRLLVDIVDAKSGYRRQGLINWMRKHSPMELKGDTINLSGVLPNGDKRPFLVEEANNTPFWLDRDNSERVMRPVYQQSLLSKVHLALKEFRTAFDNTEVKDGKATAKDSTKPYFDGVHSDKVAKFFDTVESEIGKLPVDNTAEIRKTQKQLADLQQAAA